MGEIDRAFRKLEETLETKYIRYCDPTPVTSPHDYASRQV